jgi:hypothetical protein
MPTGFNLPNLADGIKNLKWLSAMTKTGPGIAVERKRLLGNHPTGKGSSLWRA